MEEKLINERIAELTAKLALLQAENQRLKGTQQSIAEVNNNYLMLHYLTSNIQDCQTSMELWEKYLHNLSDCGFNYDDVAILLPDDSNEFTIKLKLNLNKVVQTFVVIEDEYVREAITSKTAVTAPNNLKSAVPIVTKAGEIKAVLLAEKAEGIFFEDLQLLDVYVRQTAATIENIMLNEKLRHFQELLGRQLDQFVMLHYVTKSINDAGNYYAVLTNYLTTLCSPIGFGFKEGTLYIFSENTLQRASLKNGKLELVELPPTEGQFINKVVDSRQYYLSKDQLNLFMPLNSFGIVTAVIEIKHNKEITHEQIQMLEIFAMQTSSAIVNTRLKLHLEYVSFHDQLTGLYNRAYFEKEIERIEREGLFPVGIIVCDLNGLKMVNDTWGHSTGDQFINAAASLIKNNAPPGAVVARIGGDEFSIIITGDSVNATSEAGVKLKQALDQYNATTETVPVGMAIGWSAHAGPAKILDIFKKADSLMYQDKYLHGDASRNYIFNTIQQRVAVTSPSE